MAAPPQPSSDPFNTPSGPGMTSQVGGYSHSTSSSGIQVIKKLFYSIFIVFHFLV